MKARMKAEEEAVKGLGHFLRLAQQPGLVVGPEVQVLRGAGDGVENRLFRRAGRDVRADGDLARAAEAVDLRRAGARHEADHVGQRHGAELARRHGDHFQRGRGRLRASAIERTWTSYCSPRSV